MAFKRAESVVVVADCDKSVYIALLFWLHHHLIKSTPLLKSTDLYPKMRWVYTTNMNLKLRQKVLRLCTFLILYILMQ